MKDFVNDLLQLGANDLFTLDNYQEMMAVLHVKGNGTNRQLFQNEPSRYKLIVFMLVEKGYIDVRIDYKDYRLETNTFLHVTPSHVIENISLSPDLSAYVIIVTDDFLHENRGTDKPFPFEFVLSTRHSPAMQINKEHLPMLMARIKGLQHDIRRTDHLFQKILVRNDFTSFAFELGHIIHKQWQAQPVSNNFTGKEEIMGKFMLLLIKNSHKEHNVSFYADALCISPEHLSRILKELSGDTANKWIARVLVTEIKIALKNPKVPIQQIADDLGFGDQSSLSKFFKKHCGISPMGYRERKKNYH